MTPEKLRSEADSAEAMARGARRRADRDWLMAKATALRHEAERIEQRSWRPEERRGG